MTPQTLANGIILALLNLAALAGIALAIFVLGAYAVAGISTVVSRIRTSFGWWVFKRGMYIATCIAGLVVLFGFGFLLMFSAARP